jgi:two-component system NtrC family response regulator
MTAAAKAKLLIVEDDEGLQRQLRWAYDDYEVLIASDRDAAINMLRAEEPPVVTLDLGLPPDPNGTSEGFATLEKILALKPETKVIVASGHGARESALRAIASGAYDFYQKPVDIDQLGLIVRRAFQLHGIENENKRLEQRVGEDQTVLGTMITGAPEMLKVARTIERVANTGVSVMLLGASGTGKELLARGLHDASRRCGGGFVAINCAAIPRTCSKRNCSDTRRAPSPAPSRPPRGRSSSPTAAPSSWTRSATFRCRCRSSCCASSRSG